VRRDVMQVHWIGLGTHVPPDKWGKDHKSTLLYAESRAVDHRGQLSESDPRMRMDWQKYPTTLADGMEIVGHDDYMCLEDAKAAGFLTYEGGVVKFTESGWEYAGKLRRERAERVV
jgi:hypothetical protein